MPDTRIFIGVAQQHGFSATAATVALERICEQVPGSFAASGRFYLYRTAGGGMGGGAGERAPVRKRILLAFTSADDALGFAQHYGLGTAPRLLTLSLPQLLAVLIQRPSIRAVLIAAEHERLQPDGLPAGLRIERETLLAQLVNTEQLPL
jgi:hypothetical protein